VSKKLQAATLEDNLAAVGTSLANDNVVGIGWSEEAGVFYPISVMKEIYTGESIQLGLGDPSNNYKPRLLDLSSLAKVVSTVFLFWFNQYTNTATCPVYPPKIIKEKSKKLHEKEHRSKFLEIPANDTTSLRAFTLFKKTKCCLNLRQKENRYYWQCGITEYVWVRCLFLQKEYDGGYRWVGGRYSNQKHIIFEQHLEPGEYLLIIMVEWR
jgi:hypothetical protein